MAQYKVAHLTSVHPIYDTRILYRECHALTKSGYDVVLVVPHDQNEEPVQGVRIRTVPMARNRLERMTRTTWQVYRAALKEKADIYHFHDPELLLVGVLLKLQGRSVIYDVHEDVPRDILTKHWIPRFLRGCVSKFADVVEKLASRFLSSMVFATPAIASRFKKSNSVLVQNYPALIEMETNLSIPYNQRLPLIAYIGSISLIRGIKEMVSALDLVPKELNVRLILGGEFSPASLLEEVTEVRGWDKVDFRGWVKREQVAEILGQVRIGLVIFHPADNHIESQPNKLFEYMAAGLPVVASDFPHWRKIINGAQCGLLVNPLDAKAISNAICWLIEHPEEAEAMGQRGQDAVRLRYNWGKEAEKLLSLYEDLL